MFGKEIIVVRNKFISNGGNFYEIKYQICNDYYCEFNKIHICFMDNKIYNSKFKIMEYGWD